MKKRLTAAVTEQIELAPGIWDLYLKIPEAAKEAAAGQFVNLYCHDSAHLLPRPISLAGVDKEGGILRLVYRISGAGTGSFAQLQPGDTIDLMGPLGNGFPLDAVHGKPIYLIGGGIGIPPLLETARELKGTDRNAEITAVLGYHDSRTFLADEFAAYGMVCIASEDGSVGTKGTVLDVLKNANAGKRTDCEKQQILREESCIFACGPTPMLRALKEYAAEYGIPCWLSLEERMACGVGACLACVCHTTEKDEHSQVKNRRVCKEGPVFKAEEIAL